MIRWEWRFFTFIKGDRLINENLVNAFLHFQSDPVWAKSIAKEYFISGKKDLFLGFDRTRVFYSDHWLTAFDGEFVGMQGM